MKHTPTPWATEYRQTWNGQYGQEIFDKDGQVIASAAWYPIRIEDVGTTTNREANAQHIVKCVNAHDDLIAALKTWLEEYIALVNSGDAGFWDPEKELKVIKTRELLLQVQS